MPVMYPPEDGYSFQGMTGTKYRGSATYGAAISTEDQGKAISLGWTFVVQGSGGGTVGPQGATGATGGTGPAGATGATGAIPANVAITVPDSSGNLVGFGGQTLPYGYPPPVSNAVSVLQFGADPTGVTDSSAAIQAAVNAAAAASAGARQSRAGVYFPAGLYTVTSTAVFTPSVVTVVPGIHFFGDGWYTSTIRFGTLTASTWFYDNGATARAQFLTFANLAFEGRNPTGVVAYTDIPVNANGFRITSSSNEQGFKFYSCRFGYMNVMFDMEGTNTASEIKFFGCKFHHCVSSVYTLNNAQSLNHEFYGCDIETIYGDVFNTTKGGSIKVYGGSIIMNSAIGRTTYFVNVVGLTGAGGSPLTFNGIRFEFHGNTTYLNTAPAVTQMALVFRDCLFYDQATASKVGFSAVNTYNSVNFHACFFYFSSTPPILQALGTARFGESGTMTLDSCWVPNNISDLCAYGSGASWGSIRAYNCRTANPGNSPGGNHSSQDFDLRAPQNAGLAGAWISAGDGGQGSQNDLQTRLKTVSIKLPNEGWPSTGANLYVVLPANAIIKNIHVRKPAGGAVATVTGFQVTNLDKSVVHGTTAAAAYSASHVLDITNYFYSVGITANERTIVLSSTVAVVGTISGGVAIVEYY